MAADPPALQSPAVPSDTALSDPENPYTERSSPTEVDDALVHRRVVPLRHPWRWTATLVVLVLLAQFVHGLISNPFYEWERFRYWFLRPVILEAASWCCTRAGGRAGPDRRRAGLTPGGLHPPTGRRGPGGRPAVATPSPRAVPGSNPIMHGARRDRAPAQPQHLVTQPPVIMHESPPRRYVEPPIGQIGYGIRPSARRRGLATWALNRILDEARLLGLDRVQLICLADNIASRRTIERCGGAFEMRPQRPLGFDTIGSVQVERRDHQRLGHVHR